jgi:hypothetical protein
MRPGGVICLNSVSPLTEFVTMKESSANTTLWGNQVKGICLNARYSVFHFAALNRTVDCEESVNSRWALV